MQFFIILLINLHCTLESGYDVCCYWVARGQYIKILVYENDDQTSQLKLANIEGELALY